MRVLWFVAACATASVVGSLSYLTYSTDAPAMTSTEEPAASATSWCAEGLELLSDGCFAAPAEPKGTVTMVVYLHGRYAPDTVREELDRQARVAKLATARGFAVLALRGARGECTSTEFKDYWCWPSNERNASDGPAFVERWEAPIAEARERLGAGPNVLLGFSNGGYFAELIVKRSLARFDSVAIAHGGPIAVEPVRGESSAPPMLLITADDDPSDPEMIRLDDELTRTRWPHALVAREGGHALPDWDIESALTFFTRALRERLPLSPPLESRSARTRGAPTFVDASVDDAGGEVAIDRGLDLGDL